jgi:hypothetical protein
MPTQSKPTSLLAGAALALAAIALALAVVGAFDPWGLLHFQASSVSPHPDAALIGGVFYVAPIVLGVAAALLGGRALKRIEWSQGKIGGDGLAFFAQMSGLFAAVIGACTTFAGMIWPTL